MHTIGRRVICSQLHQSQIHCQQSLFMLVAV
uniref:Uncharacterized protein n=1 Tax=Anguilla anguilla TaxID=7936 RepID=A0A0E9QXP2_ANGAN